MTKLQKEDTETRLKAVSTLLCALFIDCGRWESGKKEDVDVIEEAVQRWTEASRRKSGVQVQAGSPRMKKMSVNRYCPVEDERPLPAPANATRGTSIL